MATVTGPSWNQPVAGLVTRAKNGDNRAWDALVTRYAPYLVHLPQTSAGPR
jgi:hypothetical protein